MTQYEIVSDLYRTGYNPSRRGMIVKGQWESKYTRIAAKESVKALYLNASFGWNTYDYSFLEDMNFLEEINIIAGKVKNIHAIGSLENLTDINLNFVSSENVDFSKLSKLRCANVLWWNGARSLLDVISLEKLGIFSLDQEIDGIASIHSLKYLDIRDTSITKLDFLAGGVNISEFNLRDAVNVHDFGAISKLRSLYRLRLDGCRKLKNIEFASSLKMLQLLDISRCGNIESILALKRLRSLKALAFSGNTDVLDGNLSVIESLKLLSMVTFQPRKHYTHKLIGSWNWDNFDKPAPQVERKRGM